MNRSLWVSGVSLAFVMGVGPPRQASAQTLSLTPTFQQTVARYDSFVPQSDFQAFGFMVGMA